METAASDVISVHGDFMLPEQEMPLVQNVRQEKLPLKALLPVHLVLREHILILVQTYASIAKLEHMLPEQEICLARSVRRELFPLKAPVPVHPVRRELFPLKALVPVKNV